MPFLDSLDIANHACTHLGQRQIASVSEDSEANTLMAGAYDKLRPAELRRNSWVFAKRLAILRPIASTTHLLVPEAWDDAATYQFGSVIKDANGMLWSSMEHANVNNEPGVSDAWEQYFGPLTVNLWSSTASYYSGELVYSAGDLAGSFVIYRSLQNSNTDDPETATAWDTTVTYETGDVVSSGGYQWRSLIALNLGVTPAEKPTDYSATITYSTSQSVTGSDGYIYTSVGNGNLANDPVSDDGTYWTNTNLPAAWTRVPTLHASSVKWLPLFASMRPLNFLYPLGTGPVEQTGTKNVYRLPSGFLRKTTLDGKNPKRAYSDIEMVGKFVLSYENPLLLPFIADVLTVGDMDPMFCEGLACRMALMNANALTQSDSDFGNLGTLYQTFMTEARAVNAIELEFEEPAQDDYITVRNQ